MKTTLRQKIGWIIFPIHITFADVKSGYSVNKKNKHKKYMIGFLGPSPLKTYMHYMQFSKIYDSFYQNVK